MRCVLAVSHQKGRDMTKVAITGIGIVSPFGTGKDIFWESISNGVSGIRPITRFDASLFRTRFGGEIKDFNATEFIEAKEAARMPLFTQIGLAASIMAVKDSRINFSKISPERRGVFIGTSVGGLTFAEAQHNLFKEKGLRRISPHIVGTVIPASCPTSIAMHFNIHGPSIAISNASTSSSDAIGDAMRSILSGEIDVAITGGSDTPISEFALGIFCSARILSKKNDVPEEASRPFDKDRDGFVLSEGSAVIVLEKMKSAIERDAYIYGELLGYNRITCPSSMMYISNDGMHGARAIRNALKEAGIKPEDIDFISTHGSSGIKEDSLETEIIKRALGKHAYKIPCSAIKSSTGHTEGASGAFSLAAALLAIKNKIVPPTINYKTPDPDCDLDYVPNQKRSKEIRTALISNMGFGGRYSILVAKSV